MPDGGCRCDAVGQTFFDLVRSVPRNGATGVSPNLRTIRLVFNRNVTANRVWTNNRNQIRMYRGTTSVGISVLRSSLFANRDNIYVRPINRLRAFTNYRVVIGSNLRAITGRTLGETVTIRFRTGGRNCV